MKEHKKRFGDRADGYKVREATGLQNCCIDLKPGRNESEVYINSKVEMTNFVKFMADQKQKNENVTYFHGLCMACGKMLYKYPNLNRFVQNRTLYMHYDVTIGFVAKAKFDEKSEEFMTCLKIDEEDTLLDVTRKTLEKVEKIRNAKEEKVGGGNNVIESIGKSWRPFRSFCMGVFKFIDRKFGLPASIAAENIYYSSAIVSNLGTFKVGAIYHNLTNLGTSSSLITFGEIYEENGKYFMEIGATLDERISDGFYFCRAFKGLEYILNNPELLLEAAAKDFEMDLDIHKKNK